MLSGSKDWMSDHLGTYWRQLTKHLVFLLIISLLAFALFINYSNGALPVGTDAQELPAQIYMDGSNNQFFSSWNPYASLGAETDPIPIPSALYYLAYSWLHIASWDIAKSVMVGSFLLAGISMYVCALRLSRNYIGSVAAAVVYSMNQIYLSQIMEGHYYFVAGFALFPLLFLVYYEAIIGGHRKSIILMPIIFFIFSASVAPHMILIGSIFIILFTTAFFLSRKIPVRRLAFLGLALALLLLPIVITIFSAGSSMYNVNYPLSQAYQLSNNDLVSAFTTTSTENSHFIGGTISTWVYPSSYGDLFTALSLIFPIMAFGSLLFKKERALKLSLCLVAIILIFLAKGPNEPLSGVFTWAFDNLPFLDSLRVYSRFGMFTGFIYALLFPFLLSDLGNTDLSRISKFRLHLAPGTRLFPKNTWQVLCALAICIIILGSSSSMFIAGPDSYDLPAAYAEPFQWVGEQGGDFRTLNLPLGNIYYSTVLSKYEGYPNRSTDDPGVYSQLYTGKDTAYGGYSNNFWQYWQYVADDQVYGYKYMPVVLGEAASVKYVVAQVHALPDQVSEFAGMYGLDQVDSYSGNGSIFVNSYYLPSAHAVSYLTVATGGQSIIPAALASGVLDPSSHDLLLLGQVSDEATRSMLLTSADQVLVDNADLFELMMEQSEWQNGELTQLAEFGNIHSDNASTSWITSNDDIIEGLTLDPSVFTEGANSINVPLSIDGAGEYDIYLRLHSSPEAGNLTLSFSDGESFSVHPISTFDQETWVKVASKTLNASGASIQITNDGKGSNSLNELLVAKSSTVQDRLEGAISSLNSTEKQTVYLIQSTDLYRTLPLGWYGANGTDGRGITSITPMLIKYLYNGNGIVRNPNNPNDVAIRLTSELPSISLNVPTSIEGGLLQKILYLGLTPDGNDTDTEWSVVVSDHLGNEVANTTISNNYLMQNKGLVSLPLNLNGNEVNDYRLSINRTNGTSGVTIVGIATSALTDPMIARELFIPASGNWSFVVQTMGDGYDLLYPSGPALYLDGQQLNGTSLGDGKYLFSDVVGQGDHEVEVSTSSFYSLSVVSEGEASASQADPISVTYEKISNTEYVVHVHSDGLAFLDLSEAFSTLWTATAQNATIVHYPSYYQLNGYLISGSGNFTVTLKFQWQDDYEAIWLGTTTFAIGASVTIFLLTRKQLIK